MSAYFDLLGTELQRAAARHYAGRTTEASAAMPPTARLAGARRRMRRLSHSRIGRWPTVAIVAVVVAAGSAAAAAIPLFGGSHRLVGVVPAAALQSPGPRSLAGVPAPRLPAGLRYSVPVFPDLEAGDAGWCSSAWVTLAGAPTPLPGGPGACAPGAAGSVVIIAGGEPLTNVFGYLPGARPPATKPGAPSRARATQALLQALQDDVFLNWFVVSDRVAAIRINGTTFVPRPDQNLAPSWRAVVAFTRGSPTSIEYVQRDGRPISTLGGPAGQGAQPVTTVDPRHLPAALCALGAAHLPALGSEWEVIANSTPAPGSAAESGVLFSCARAWYAFPRSHAVYSAAILLNAQNPKERAPQLPGLTPDPRTGDFEEGVNDSAEITARRIANAWLVVQGPNQKQRQALLHNITASGRVLHT
jgi:hypothetical protein